MAHAGNRAFTLIELMVAMAILAVVVVLLSSVFSSTQRGASYIGNAAFQRQDARAVLNHISKDLSSALGQTSRSFEDANTAGRQPQLLLNPPGLGTNLQNASSIFWISQLPSNKGGSALVGYVLRWETTADGPRPRLCRMFLNTADSQPVRQSLRLSTSVPEWASENLVNTAAPGTADSGFQGWFADNILALYARALDPNMAPITNYARQLSGPAVNTTTVNAAFPGSATGDATLGAFDSGRGYQFRRTSDNVTVNRFGPALPAAVELVVISAPPSVIRQLQTAPAAVRSADAARMWDDISAFLASLPPNVKNAARTYSTIVPLSVQQ